MDWQPMETAPHSGHILLYLDWIGEVHEGYWSTKGRRGPGWRILFNTSVASGVYLTRSQPSCWQPMPAPPKI